jgi:hypothetical protein
VATNRSVAPASKRRVETAATLSHLVRAIRVPFRTLAAHSRHAVVALAVLGTGCATGNGGATAAGQVRLETPDDACEPLGSLGVRMSTELLLPEGSLLDAAVTELRLSLPGALTGTVARPMRQS